MLGQLILNHYEAAAVILSGIGLATLLFHRNLIKKILGLNIMDSACFLFLAAKGYVARRAAPILLPAPEGRWVVHAGAYVNPIPAGLVLTGIVVSVSVTAFALALTLRFYKHYGTLDIDAVFTRTKGPEPDEDNSPDPATQKMRERLEQEGLL